MVIQVAETCAATTALGPGLRSVAWVQGCPLACHGCIAPDWISADRPARAMTPAELAAELLAHPDVSGFTFSGGEPMAQAAGLAEAIRIARDQRDLTLVCFTGYRLAELTRRPAAGVRDLLAQTDVLIDGRYVAARNDDRGLRGSANQRVHFLTGRLADAAAELRDGQRRTEIRLRGSSALLVGVPVRPVAAAFAHLPAKRW
jgi:anaerobic ribonucleoside-triphosphate reductase activating protein